MKQKGGAFGPVAVQTAPQEPQLFTSTEGTEQAPLQIVAPGTQSFEELLAEAEYGIYVTDVAGLHSGVNPVSGTFSVGATGRLISGGGLADPADEFTIASDLTSLLKAVRATGADSLWVPFGGSVNAPPLLIAEMAIGGA